jgi:hypothetical protein
MLPGSGMVVNGLAAGQFLKTAERQRWDVNE